MIGSLHEECGVFGLLETKTTDVANTAYLALYALQHRGQEACGVVVNDDGVFAHHKGNGLVHEVFPEAELKALGKGNMAIGHVRYSTTGGKDLGNVQPLVIRHIKGNLALAHNGNLVNADEIRRKFELAGGIFHGTSDTEAVAYAIAANRLKSKSTEEAVEKTMAELSGAYSCLVMTATKLIAFRDPNGFRPLCLGQMNDGAWVVSSESCAFDAIGATFVRDVLPGEILVITREGVRSIETYCGRTQGSICVFEYIYFARPDSVIDGASVHLARRRAGAFLAKEHPVEADLVIGVPDSGLDAALGYAEESGIPYGIGFIKNRYIGRSFIEPSQEQREDAVRIKLNAIGENIRGKRIIMIDDSIVRGTTSARIVALLREAGAKEVHMRVSSPPFRHACYFGTDVDSSDRLIACRYETVEEIGREIGVDSLGYLSMEATRQIAEGASVGFCTGCFTGDYPIPVPTEIVKNKFDEKLGEYGVLD